MVKGFTRGDWSWGLGYLKVTPSSICGFTDGKGSASARKRLHENSYSWIYLLFVIRSQSLIRRFPEPRCKQNPEPQILSPKLPLLRKPNSKNLAKQGALLPAALAVLADLLGLTRVSGVIRGGVGLSFGCSVLFFSG